MVKRKIITIDNEKCNGCGICVPNCAEGALQIIDEKARLISDLFCDGLGACLGHCPQSAISIEEREAVPYDERAVMEKNIVPAGVNTIKAHLEHLRDHGADGFFNEAIAYLKEKNINNPLEEKVMDEKKETKACGCPGSKIMDLRDKIHGHGGVKISHDKGGVVVADRLESQLQNWPVQITLASPYAPYFKNADLVIIADCVAYAYAETHREFIKDKVVLIGCPKLDNAAAYVDKISEIIRAGELVGIKVVRMEVPCCGGMVDIVKQAIVKSGKVMPFETVTISINGEKL